MRYWSGFSRKIITERDKTRSPSSFSLATIGGKGLDKEVSNMRREHSKQAATRGTWVFCDSHGRVSGDSMLGQ